MTQTVPLGLADMLPGPELCAALSSVPLPDLVKDDLLDTLTAEYRQLAYQQARFYAVLAEVGQRDPAKDGLRVPFRSVHQHSWLEVSTELNCSDGHALNEMVFADEITLRFPQIGAALSAGRIDRYRAWILTEFCTGLSAEHAGVVVDGLLAVADQYTGPQLRARGKRMATALDPAWARRKCEQALKGRRVAGRMNADGTANVSGMSLPADEAAFSVERVERLARMAKTAGYPAPGNYAETDVYLGLLSGRYGFLTDEQIVEAMVRTCDYQLTVVESVNSVESEPAKANSTSDDNSAAADEVNSPAPAETPVEPVPVYSPAGVELRASISTLMGLDDRAVEIAGLGVTIADVGRSIAATQRHCEWRWAVIDADGRLLFDGITRRRPLLDSDDVQATGGVIELHVPVSMLTAPDVPMEWAVLLADIAAQHTRQQRPVQDPRARFPGEPLRRHVQIRDRRCVWPTCNRPARRSDQDHTRDYDLGGVTAAENLGPLCRKHHMARTKGRWRLKQTAPGEFEWISPIGRRHRVKRRLIAPPLPHPQPEDHPPNDWEPVERDGPILERPPSPPEPHPERTTEQDDVPPPF